MTGLTMRRFLAPVFTLAALVCAPVPASAQQSETIIFGQELGWLEISSENTFSIHVLDGARDRCWTNMEAVKNAVAIELQRSGYKVDISEEAALSSKIWLQVVGYEITNVNCAVRYDLLLNYFNISSFTFDEAHKVNSVHFPQMWDDGGIMSGPKSDMSQRIKNQFVESAQKLLIQIPQKRREVLKAVREAAAAAKDVQPEAYRYWMNFPD